jgi:hypothetical protein
MKLHTSLGLFLSKLLNIGITEVWLGFFIFKSQPILISPQYKKEKCYPNYFMKKIRQLVVLTGPLGGPQSSIWTVD